MKPAALSGITRKNLFMYSSEQNLSYDIYISSLVQMKGILAAKYSVVFLKMSYLLTSVNKTDIFLRLKNEKCRYLLPPPMTKISTGIVMYELYIDSVPISELATQGPQNLAGKMTVLHPQLCFNFMCEIPALPPMQALPTDAVPLTAWTSKTYFYIMKKK